MTLDEIDSRILDLMQTNAALTNQEIAAAAFVSPPTAMRRIKRLRETGVIAREVAILNDDSGLSAICEVTLDVQNEQAFGAFEQHVSPYTEVQQCYQTSGSCDFVLVLRTNDMTDYQRLAQRLFTQHTNVRNVKSLFASKRVKFDPRIVLSPGVRNA